MLLNLFLAILIRSFEKVSKNKRIANVTENDEEHDQEVAQNHQEEFLSAARKSGARRDSDGNLEVSERA